MAFGIVLMASGSKGNVCLVEHRGVRLLIDCGTTKKYLMDGLMSLGLGIQDLDALLVTHDHSDHTKQIHHFNDCQVFTPEPLSDKHISVVPYESFQVGHLTIFPIKTSHDAEVSVGYVIDDGIDKVVYITDTGYIKEVDLIYLTGADIIVLESNHDPELLMKTNRPFYIKQRILSDKGHLSNDESGKILGRIVTSKTKEIVLAHLSEEANTGALAVETVQSYLNGYQIDVRAAKQFEFIYGGVRREK